MFKSYTVLNFINFDLNELGPLPIIGAGSAPDIIKLYLSFRMTECIVVVVVFLLRQLYTK